MEDWRFHALQRDAYLQGPPVYNVLEWIGRTNKYLASPMRRYGSNWPKFRNRTLAEARKNRDKVLRVVPSPELHLADLVPLMAGLIERQLETDAAPGWDKPMMRDAILAGYQYVDEVLSRRQSWVTASRTRRRPQCRHLPRPWVVRQCGVGTPHCRSVDRREAPQVAQVREHQAQRPVSGRSQRNWWQAPPQQSPVDGCVSGGGQRVLQVSSQSGPRAERAVRARPVDPRQIRGRDGAPQRMEAGHHGRGRTPPSKGARPHPPKAPGGSVSPRIGRAMLSLTYEINNQYLFWGNDEKPLCCGCGNLDRSTSVGRTVRLRSGARYLVGEFASREPSSGASTIER
ncbi:hypothetical protein [Streptomyces wuyuanensis]|uniref:hypothetical protein n=1 Tax=Streptomyces wuyuanensis TaxID=1196353 RepID=UPI0034278522